MMLCTKVFLIKEVEIAEKLGYFCYPYIKSG